jgi:pectate lyase
MKNNQSKRMKAFIKSIIRTLPILVLIVGFRPSINYADPGTARFIAPTSGGRDGKIIKVTTLQAEGKGSLLEALQTKGKRIIVFEVGGVIDLKGKSISIKEPYLTVAGQTAPSPGITLIDGGVTISTHDVILQHIRIRPGASRHEVGWEPDGLTTSSASHVLIDQCTFTWAVDENCSASGPRFNGVSPDEWRKNTSHHITISNCIIAEGLSKSTHPKGEHSKGTLIHDNASHILIIGNLYASNVERNVLFKGGARGVQVNNYIYNPSKRAIHYALVASEWEGHTWEKGQLTIIGNVLQLGQNSIDIPLMTASNGPCEIFMEDNFVFRKDGQPGKLFSGDETKLVKARPVWIEGTQVIPAGQVKDSVLKTAGARPWDRDLHDKRVIQSVIDGTSKIIHSEEEVGGYPTEKPTREKFNEKKWNLSDMTRK